MSLEFEPNPMETRPTASGEPADASGQVPPRRRFLKHGLAGGSVALLVAGKPVKTLAKAYCKFSGWNSLKASKKKKGGLTLSHAPATCSVKVEPPSHYYKKTKSRGKTTYSAIHWPTNKFNSVLINTSTTFAGIFGTDPISGWGSKSLLSILSTESSSVEAHMIALAFASTAGGFPLSQSYVSYLWTEFGNVTHEASLLTFIQQLV
jgi:hypothetical protein